MPRSPDPAKRRELLDQVRQYVIRNGLVDLSLRPLARALGTSDRMLLYYFGTKERMIADALALDESFYRFCAPPTCSKPSVGPQTRRGCAASWRKCGACSAPPTGAP